LAEFAVLQSSPPEAYGLGSPEPWVPDPKTGNFSSLSDTKYCIS
jgi:hypothetical protein